ncbi:MAG: hypothetical protein AAFN11_19425, partial [Chloroflexota bacterium]
DEERKMMLASLNDIDRSDFLLAEHSTTIAGISTYIVTYSSIGELEEKLSKVIVEYILKE